MTDPIRIQSTPKINNPSGSNPARPAPQGSSFADTLAQKTELKFSNHAQKRLQVRDITLDDDGLNRLANAVDKVEKRGGKESLVLMDDLAFIVNVREHLVVTALDAKERGEGVFTRIDSVVLAD